MDEIQTYLYYSDGDSKSSPQQTSSQKIPLLENGVKHVVTSQKNNSESRESIASSEGSMNEYEVDSPSEKEVSSVASLNMQKGPRKITIKANCSVVDEPYHAESLDPSQVLVNEEVLLKSVKLCVSLL